jgi:hypothetical protein
MTPVPLELPPEPAFELLLELAPELEQPAKMAAAISTEIGNASARITRRRAWVLIPGFLNSFWWKASSGQAHTAAVFDRLEIRVDRGPTARVWLLPCRD